MKRREKSRVPILAAGGIVMRGGREPVIAVVQLRKCNSWVLPKGKLNGNESILAAARREVLEEVGHKVHIHEFLGTMAHDVGNRTKIVQFWRMRAVGDPVRSTARDVKAVRWLSLEEALEKLSRPRERAFLESVAPVVRQAIERSARQDRSVEPRSVEPVADTGPIEPVAQLPDVPTAEPLQPSAVPVLEPLPSQPDVFSSAAAPARDTIADKARFWLRRIALITTQPARRA